MEPTPVESKVVPEPAPAVEVALPTETPATTVAAPVPEPAASVVPAEKPAEEPKAEEPAPAQEQTAPEPEKEEEKEEEEYMEEEEEEEEEVVDDEEWVSDEEPYARKRGRRSHMSESEEDEDEDYGKSKKRKVTPPKKPVRRNVTANEPAGMRALRDYTSALKLGPRCFRNLNKISNVKDREAELIRRLHDNGRQWEGEYPTPKEIEEAKEETRMKKAEKAKQYILEEDLTGIRTSRKAAQKARDFVKTLGEEESDEDVKDEEVDAASVEEDVKDEE
ncbi:hypothetical protein WA538_000139 [Blastocystis sp. DL]